MCVSVAKLEKRKVQKKHKTYEEQNAVIMTDGWWFAGKEPDEFIRCN